MSETKHTATAWLLAGEDKTFVYALGPHGTNNFWAHVQTAGPEKISKEEAVANARLIAAAPELLASLVAMTSAFESHLPDHCNADWYQEWSDAKAAIAKATGSSA